jgi:hypothetical protein
MNKKGHWKDALTRKKLLDLRKYKIPTLYPMMRSGLMEEPDLLMMGMNMEKVVEIRYMFRISGTCAWSSWAWRNMFRSENYLSEVGMDDGSLPGAK